MSKREFIIKWVLPCTIAGAIGAWLMSKIKGA